MKKKRYYIIWISHLQPDVTDYSVFDGTYQDCIEYVRRDNRIDLGGAIIADSHNIKHAVNIGLLKPRIDENWKTIIKSEHHEMIKDLYDYGLGAPKIGALFKCSYSTIYRIVNPEKYAKR